MFAKGFPKFLESDVKYVCSNIPFNTYRRVTEAESDEKSTWKISDKDSVSIPYRIYLTDCVEKAEENFTDIQTVIYHCIFTRSCNGFVREKHIRALLEADVPYWAVPYILKVCDEYVVQILEAVYERLSEADTMLYKEIWRLNPKKFICGYSRMISYWNEFYRDECPIFKDYIGKALFEKCFGYTRSMEKIFRIVSF
ncbi:MAG: hypothetical protein E7508_12205 [Ruminococcus sp.]|nr:hypothetical protein [Ruminococcus sp.]